MFTNKYILTLAYDGTAYHGWQIQDDKPTVAGVLSKTFQDIFGIPCSILGASRTDTGVHAHGQVVRIRTDLNIEPEKLLRAWDNSLPADIVIRSLEKCPEGFSPLHNVKNKTYWYYFSLKRPLPAVQRFGWYYRYPVNIEKLKEALKIFVGTHDFRSFTTGNDMCGGTVRTINSITLEYIPEWDMYRIAVTGPRFMRYMIRRLVGAALEVASREHLSVNYLEKALAQKDPHQPLLPKAPGKGLTLHKIEYETESSHA